MKRAAVHTEPESRFDWEAARQKLARLKESIDEVDSPTAERIRRILHERAQSLAAPRVDARPAAVIRLIVFSRRGQRWAIDSDQVEEVIDIATPTPLPWLPTTYVGLIHHRGAVYPVVDVGVLFGIASGEPGQHIKALIINAGNVAVAIAADAIEGHRQIDAASVAEMAEGAATHQALQGLTPDHAIVFDGHRLLADARLIVNDQPAATTKNEGDKK